LLVFDGNLSPIGHFDPRERLDRFPETSSRSMRPGGLADGSACQ
jgi:hypothetical protein